MSPLRRVIVFAVLAAVALGLAPVVAGASTQSDLARMRIKIAAARKQKASLNDQIALLDGRLAVIDGKLEGLGDEIDAVELRLATTREKLDVLQEQLRLKRIELQRAETKLEFEQQGLEMRMVAAYKTSDLTYIDIIMASTTFEDLVSRVGAVNALISGNDALVGRMEDARDGVEREKEAIAEKESGVHKAFTDLEDQSNQLAALRASQAAEQAAALATRKEKSGALASVESNLAQLEKQEDQLIAESNALSGVINGSSGGGGGTGSLIWPVNGPVTSPYGWRIHPILHVRKLHTGIDIGVGYGVPIKAADSGTVIYATWMSGYGNVIIVDHGSGISTLYAHQSSLAVGNGSTVARGQVVGYVGSTGFSTGPHLHFEVRVNGSPVDPMGYLP